jgi:hypothetical protein
MKANELRINNWVEIKQIKKGVYTTIQPSSFTVDINIHYKPILLTEEWLLKFGFEKIIYGSEETGYGTDYHLKCNNDVFMCYADDFSVGLFESEKAMKTDLGVLPTMKNINTVHGLQNLYFALTGEELQIEKQ